MKNMATFYGTNGNDLINGTTLNDYIDGGIGNDILNGDAGNDTLRGHYGNDTIDGGTGIDTAVFYGNRADYAIIYDAATQKFTATDNRNPSLSGVDTLSNIENFRFLDGTITAASLLVTTPFTTGNDTYYGTTANELLNGLDGNDYIDGGYGHDTLNGDGGNDTLRGNYGNDVLDGGAGDDTAFFTGNRADYNITYNASTFKFTVTDLRSNTPSGIDTITNVEHFQFADGTIATALLTPSLQFTNGNDTYHGSAANELLNGLDGNDYINGGIGNDTINGDGGNDTLRGNYGNDVLDGGAGDDTAFYSGKRADYSIIYDPATQKFLITDLRLNAPSGIDSVTNIEHFQFLDGTVSATSLQTSPTTFTQGNDTYYGTTANETLDGLGGNDYIDGGYGHDNIKGGAGNDTLRGNYGNDTLDGGADNDTVLYTGNRWDYAIWYNAGTQTFTVQDLRNNTPSGRDTVKNVENFHFADGILTAAEVNATPLFTNGNDTWFGSSLADNVNGLDGNDGLDGGAGNDSLGGGAGNDYINGGTGDDTLLGESGNDTLTGNSGSDVIDGGAGTDTAIYAGYRANYDITYDSVSQHYTLKERYTGTITNIDDVVNVENFQFADGTLTAANLHATVVNGGFIFTQGADNWSGTAGNDSVFALGGNDTLHAGFGNDYVNGGAGNDWIDGGAGNDLLQGGDGDDTLIGCAGNDTLDGAAGEDTVIYMGNASDFTLTFNATLNQYTVKDNRTLGNQGTDLVTQVEHFNFNGHIYDATQFITALPANGLALVDLNASPYHI
jgi:Ca2+-binding RTX toxin-like protein